MTASHVNRRRILLGPGAWALVRASAKPLFHARALAPVFAGPFGLLAGCSGTLLPKPAPPQARFTLDRGDAPTATPRAAAPGAPVLLLALPRAAPGHDSRRMLYQHQPQALQAFAFHERVEPPAQLLAPLLLRPFQQRAGFCAVLLAPSAGAAGWRLETEQLRLLQDFSSQPSQVRLSLRAVPLDGTTRQVLAWRKFDISVAATAENPMAGAPAAGVRHGAVALRVAERQEVHT